MVKVDGDDPFNVGMSANVVYLEGRGRLHEPADGRGGSRSRRRSAAAFPELLAQKDIDADGRRRQTWLAARIEAGSRVLAGTARRHAVLLQMIGTIVAVLVLVLTIY
ncbi:hypothetical protein ACRDNQ_11205 [Palleronia sp. KMU-117]|uniref:hypothetical protein n=1 Tax=Palleronia sp. KMU-117 TaxID=3434108 RepID=UPI003D7065FC